MDLQLMNLTEFDNSDLVLSIFLKQYDDTLHTGIVYKPEEDDKLKIIHLAFHEKLDNEEIKKEDMTYYCINHNLETYRQRDLSGRFQTIYERNHNTLKYGISFRETEFLPSGLVKYGHGEWGLTCATFVLAAFRRLGIELVDVNVWPKRDEDKNWQDRIVKLLRKRSNATEEHIEKVSHDIDNCPRFRPEEVCASISLEPYPAFHETIWERGAMVKNEVMSGIQCPLQTDDEIDIED